MVGRDEGTRTRTKEMVIARWCAHAHSLTHPDSPCDRIKWDADPRYNELMVSFVLMRACVLHEMRRLSCSSHTPPHPTCLRC